MTAPVRVLVVDDDPMQLELIERGLARDGFEVRCVSELAALPGEAQRFAPVIVLIDVNMPEAVDARTIVGVREAAPGARILLHSSWEDSRLRAVARQLGADGFISKSESVVAIGRRLHELQRGNT